LGLLIDKQKASSFDNDSIRCIVNFDGKKVFHLFLSFLIFENPDVINIAFQGFGYLVGSVDPGYDPIVCDVAQMMT